MQVGVVGQLSAGAAVTERVARVLAVARANGFRVIFTRHLSLPAKLMGRFQMRQAMAWQHVAEPAQVHPWFLRDGPGFPIVPELTPQVDEAVLDKLALSAFEGTPLEMVLRDCGLIAFAILGIATEIGIDPTVRHGVDLGLIPVVVQDACGAGDEAAAERGLANIAFSGDAIMTDGDALCAALAFAPTSRARWSRADRTSRPNGILLPPPARLGRRRVHEVGSLHWHVA
jgi:nicotinamidase-related amidase